jgi:hypothetical protein
MRRTLAFLFVTVSASLGAYIAQSQSAPALAPAGTPAAQARILEAYGKLPLSFEQNAGQSDARVRFLARGERYTVFLTGDSAVIRLDASLSTNVANIEAGPQQTYQSASQPSSVIRLTLANSNPHSELEGLEQQSSRSNYFIGSDPSRWRQNVTHFARIQSQGVYPGIDLLYHGNQGQLESDYVISPGSDPRQIALQIDGADRLQLDPQGNFVLSTASGDISLRRPRAYQKAGGRAQEIAANFVQEGEHLICIQVGPYDTQRPLIIDPVLAYSTYLGGSTSQSVAGIAADSNGFAYVTGGTSSSDFPVTTGSFQTTPGNSARSAYVAKLNQAGTALVYSTFLSGRGAKGDAATAIGIDGSGDAYIVGFATSTDFPTTSATAYQTVNKGGGGFFSQLGPAGATLLYSTYLSGSGTDRLQGIAVDANGNAYITGSTTSTDFPNIPSTAIQTTNNASTSGQVGTAFLSRLDPTKVGTASLVYSTYIGGTKEESGLGVAVDATSNAYITGYTFSSDFPMNSTNKGFQTTLLNTSGGNAFVARIDTTQPNVLVYSTFLGSPPNGSGSNPGEVGNGIALGPSGNAYMVGYSYSTNYPLVNPLDSVSNFPNQKTVVSRIDTTKSGVPSLVYSSYFGGTKLNSTGTLPGVDLGFGIALDSAGDIYLAGTSRSVDFPVTPGAPQPAIVGIQNATMAELNPAGSAVLFATFLGGSLEAANGIALDGASPANAYIGGATGGNFPTTPSAFQIIDKVTNPNNVNGFVAKLSPGAVTGVFATPANLAFGNQTVKTASAAQTVTLTNDSSSTLTITGATFSGTNASDFSQTTTCGSTLAAKSACTYSIVFTPSTTAAETATFSIADSDSSSPQTVSLTGTGTQAQSGIALSPSSLTFGNSPQVVTLTNNRTSALTITGITITGPNAADFSQTNTCGTSVAAGANCTITVTFKASTTGPESATLSIADSDPSSPQTVALSNSAGSGDFTISATPASASITAGGTASYTATLTSVNGFTGTVTLSCTGAPLNSTCTVSPSSETLAANGSQTPTASLVTTARGMLAPPVSFRPGPHSWPRLWVLCALVLALLSAWITTRQGARKLAWGFAVVSVLALSSCSGLPQAQPPQTGTPAGTYTLTITGVSGSLTHSTTVSVTVN